MSDSPHQENFVIVIHGGAEDQSREDVGPEKEKAYRQGLHEARQVYHDKIEKDRSLIALSPDGEIALEYETKLMFRGYRKGQEPPFVAIWED